VLDLSSSLMYPCLVPGTDCKSFAHFCPREGPSTRDEAISRFIHVLEILVNSTSASDLSGRFCCQSQILERAGASRSGSKTFLLALLELIYEGFEYIPVARRWRPFADKNAQMIWNRGHSAIVCTFQKRNHMQSIRVDPSARKFAGSTSSTQGAKLLR
jgi:hypothetical protein